MCRRECGDIRRFEAAFWGRSGGADKGGVLTEGMFSREDSGVDEQELITLTGCLEEETGMLTAGVLAE